MNAPPAAATNTGLGRRLARNTLHSASGRVVGMVAWLVLTPHLYRSLGAELFGIWSLFYALTGWLASLDFGFSQVALRFVAAARSRGDAVEGGQFATLSILAYAAFGLAWIAIVPFATPLGLDVLRIPAGVRAEAALAMWASPPVFMMSGVLATLAAVLQAHDRFDLANWTTVSVSVGQVAGIVIAIANRMPFESYLGAIAFGWCLGAVVGLVLLAVGVRGFAWAGPGSALARARAAFRFGGPVQFSNTLAVAHQQIDKLLVARFVSLASVAPYEIGMRVTAAAATFAQMAVLAMIPAISALDARGDHARVLDVYRRAGRYARGLSAMVTAASIATAPHFLKAWLGHAEPTATLVMQGLSLSAYAALAGSVLGAVARGVGRPMVELEWSVVALAVHVVLGIPLVAQYGLVGAVAALLAGNIAGAMWFHARLARALHWPARLEWIEPFAIPVVAMAAGSAAGLALGTRVGGGAWIAAGVTASVGALVAAAVLAMTRYVSWREALELARTGSVPT